MHHPLPRRQRRSPGRLGATPSVPRPEDVRCPEDALAVVLATASHRDTLVALLLSDERSSGASITFEDVYDEDVASVLLMLCEAAPTDGELILASIRHGRGVTASMDEVYVWFDLCSIAEAEGVRLIDWFLIDGESARSMAETTFSEDRW